MARNQPGLDSETVHLRRKQTNKLLSCFFLPKIKYLINSMENEVVTTFYTLDLQATLKAPNSSQQEI